METIQYHGVRTLLMKKGV